MNMLYLKRLRLRMRRVSIVKQFIARPAFKRFIILSVMLFSLTFSLSWAYLTIPQHFLSLDNRLRDFLFIMRGSINTTGDVIIVDIDEQSIRHYGQWPWSRHIVASLVDELRDGGAGIIGFDIIFAESDSSAPKLKTPSANGCSNLYDQALASAIETSPVIGGYFFSYDFNTTEEPSIPAVFIEKGLTKERYIPELNGVRLNIDCLQNAMYSSGFFNTMPDSSGAIRHVPMLMRYHDILYPSLSLEMIRILTDTSKVILYNSSTGAEYISLNALTIPTDRHARISVNFRGPGHHFHYISALDIIEKKVDPKEFEGKFVLIGTSAVGLSDLKATPFDNVMPGVEIHANVIDSILANDLIAKPNDAELINLGIILGTVIIASIGLYLFSSWMILPLLMIYLYGMYYFFDLFLFEKGMILNLLFPLIALVLTTIIILLMRFAFTARQKQLLQHAFSQKVSPAVMNDIMMNETHKLLKPREKNVTIFFSDIRSFTSISEAIANPTRTIQLLNTYMTPMVDIIINHKGTVDKFIGDAIMAYWNAPTDIKNHADLAVQTALEQLEKLEELNHEIKVEYDTLIRIGIGIHTGVVTIGEMGSLGRSDYTIIGDNVNLGSRLEGLCKTYGVTLIISEETKKMLTQPYVMRELDMVKVKGKNRSITIYQVLSSGKITAEQEREFEHYYRALDLYRKAKFEEAESHFIALMQVYPQTLYEMYQQRCRFLIDEAISDFNGVFTFTTK